MCVTNTAKVGQRICTKLLTANAVPCARARLGEG